MGGGQNQYLFVHFIHVSYIVSIFNALLIIKVHQILQQSKIIISIENIFFKPAKDWE